MARRGLHPCPVTCGFLVKPTFAERLPMLVSGRIFLELRVITDEHICNIDIGMAMSVLPPRGGEI